MTMEQELQLENFQLETKLLEEQMQRELSQFELETALIEKGVL